MENIRVFSVLFFCSFLFFCCLKKFLFRFVDYLMYEQQGVILFKK
uniref:Uncharacterized protein n=1 Tax=Anguilla anguilla TaxID=7936 RepID=A0A0E9Q9R5_ANGAN